MTNELEVRVAKLERENRWMKRGAAVAALVAGALVLMGAGKKESPKIVAAQRFVLLNDSGELAGEWNTQGAPSGWLAMKASDGRFMTLDPSGVTVSTGGKPRLIVGVHESGSVQIHLNEPGAREALGRGITLSASAAGSKLSLNGDDGKDLALLISPAGEDQLAAFSLSDRNNVPRVWMGTATGGTASLSLNDRKQKPRVFLAVGEAGAGIISKE